VSNATGRLVIVNGGSSVGKTSFCRALQDMLWERKRQLYCLLGIDAFWFSLPPRQLDLERVEAEFYTTETYEEKGLPYFIVHPGPLLDQVMYARYRAIKAYLDRGLNVISDDVLWKREWLEDAVQLLADYNVVFVGARISDAEGARREEIRGDRHPGWDRGSQRTAHRDALYDEEIDTTYDTPQTSAAKIFGFLESGLQPSAFARLRERFARG
jgi:chloramphenicol 3-O phosphotransferase